MGRRGGTLTADDLREKALAHPCSSCPWRTANHGKAHAHGWFTKANRTRLWAGIRRGERMTCHRTDPENVVPDDQAMVPEGTPVAECAGAQVLVQRELGLVQSAMQADPERGFATYRRQRPGGLTMEGAYVHLAAHAFAGVPMIGSPLPSRAYNLAEPVGTHQVPWPC